jgi:hypothetical protein
MAQAGAFGDPADRVTLVTPSDATDLTGVRGIMVGTSGTLVVRMVNAPDTSVTIPANAVVAGNIYPIRVTRIMAASTASEIVAFW